MTGVVVTESIMRMRSHAFVTKFVTLQQVIALISYADCRYTEGTVCKTWNVEIFIRKSS